MIDAITVSKEDVREQQQEMIRAAAKHGLNLKNVAALTDVEASYVRHIMSDSGFIGSARWHVQMLAVVSALDQDQFVESLLPLGKFVCTDPDVEINSCYLDEIRESAEVTGKISEHERHADHFSLRGYFRNLKIVATRGEKEAAAAMRGLSL